MPSSGLLMRIPRRYLFSALLALLVLIVFSPVGGFDFVLYDDGLNIKANVLITNFSHDSLWRFWRQPYEGLYIPLTYTLWGVLAKLSGGAGGLDPAPFHIANLLLHTATATVLFSMLRILVKDDWAALGGALFFALHPLVVESVAWISELKGLLSGLLSVLALRQYLIYGATAGKAGFRPFDRNYLLAFLFFVAALLAKPSAIILPLLAALLAYLSLSRPGKTILCELAPWLIPALLLTIVTKYSQADSNLPFLPNYWQRLLIAGDALSFYFQKILLPFNLAPDYGRTASVVLASKYLYLTGLLPWLLLPVALLRKFRPWLIVVLFPVAALLPVLGFLPFTFQAISSVADRYIYLGLIGPALGIALLLARYRSRNSRVLMVVALAILTVATHIQLRHWRNSPTLENHILTVNPRSWVAHHNLATYLSRQNRITEAIFHYQESIRIQPDAWFSYYYLGFAQIQNNDLQGAIVSYQMLLRMRPDYLPAYKVLGMVYEKTGNLTEAIKVFEKSVAVKPDFIEGYVSLGRLYAKMNREDESLAAYAKAKWHPVKGSL